MAIRHMIYVFLAIFLCAICIISCHESGRFIGKGDFISYIAANRSGMRVEDVALAEYIPPDASHIRIWLFRYCGAWGGSYRIGKTQLDAWLADNKIALYEGAAVIISYESENNYKKIDTSKGAVYRAARWKGTNLAEEFLMCYNKEDGIVYFTLAIE